MVYSWLVAIVWGLLCWRVFARADIASSGDKLRPTVPQSTTTAPLSRPNKTGYASKNATVTKAPAATAKPAFDALTLLPPSVSESMRSARAKITISPSASAVPFRAPDKLPNDDEFYRPPKGFEKKNPGDILRYRVLPKPLSLNGTGSGLKTAGQWQILYRSTGSHGQATATVVTLLKPANAKPKSLYVYNWFSDATFADCVPSVGMQLGTRPDNAFTQSQTFLVVSGLAQGWYVAMPDDGGPTGIFANGVYQGQAVLDSIRAVKKSGNFSGIDVDPTVTMYGFSGGAIPGSWALELQPTYAPDVKIAGGAYGGALPNTTAIMESFKTNFVRQAYGPPVIVGLAKDFKNFTEWLDQNLIPERAAEFRQVYFQCYDSNWDLFAGRYMGDYFKRGYDSVLEGIPRQIMDSVATLGFHGRPGAPLYVHHAVLDDASPVSHVDALMEKYCKEGSNILYERNEANVTHAQELVAGLPGAMRWMLDRQLGKPLPNNKCVTVPRTAESKLAEQQGLQGKGMMAALLAYLGIELGPNPWLNWLTEFPAREVELSQELRAKTAMLERALANKER